MLVVYGMMDCQEIEKKHINTSMSNRIVRQLLNLCPTHSFKTPLISRIPLINNLSTHRSLKLFRDK